MLLAFLNWLADAGVLAASIAAVGAPVPWRDLLFVYAVGTAVASAGVVPGGLGVVEGALALTLMGAGLRHPVALAAVLIYRLISFWMVISVGWLIYFLAPGRAIEEARERRRHACPGSEARWGTLTSGRPCSWTSSQGKSPDRRASDETSARPERQAAPGHARSVPSGQLAEGPARAASKTRPSNPDGGSACGANRDNVRATATRSSRWAAQVTQMAICPTSSASPRPRSPRASPASLGPGGS